MVFGYFDDIRVMNGFKRARVCRSTPAISVLLEIPDGIRTPVKFVSSQCTQWTVFDPIHVDIGSGLLEEGTANVGKVIHASIRHRKLTV